MIPTQNIVYITKQQAIDRNAEPLEKLALNFDQRLSHEEIENFGTRIADILRDSLDPCEYACFIPSSFYSDSGNYLDDLTFHAFDNILCLDNIQKDLENSLYSLLINTRLAYNTFNLTLGPIVFYKYLDFCKMAITTNLLGNVDIYFVYTPKSHTPLKTQYLVKEELQLGNFKSKHLADSIHAQESYDKGNALNTDVIRLNMVIELFGNEKADQCELFTELIDTSLFGHEAPNFPLEKVLGDFLFFFANFIDRHHNQESDKTYNDHYLSDIFTCVQLVSNFTFSADISFLILLLLWESCDRSKNEFLTPMHFLAWFNTEHIMQQSLTICSIPLFNLDNIPMKKYYPCVIQHQSFALVLSCIRPNGMATNLGLSRLVK
jgi:hypothetical protein